eukprot:7037066-Pyramimonas_sp.AAC.1
MDFHSLGRRGAWIIFISWDGAGVSAQWCALRASAGSCAPLRLAAAESSRVSDRRFRRRHIPSRSQPLQDLTAGVDKARAV